MNDETRHRVIWGWLRLFLGFAQMSLVALSVGALFTIGLHSLTVTIIIGATAATIISRLIYGGRKDPKLERKQR